MNCPAKPPPFCVPAVLLLVEALLPPPFLALALSLALAGAGRVGGEAVDAAGTRASAFASGALVQLCF